MDKFNNIKESQKHDARQKNDYLWFHLYEVQGQAKNYLWSEIIIEVRMVVILGMLLTGKGHKGISSHEGDL